MTYLKGTVGGHILHGIRNAVESVDVVQVVQGPVTAIGAGVVGPAVGGVNEIQAK